MPADRIHVTIAAEHPQPIAESLEAALKRSTSDWPLPGTWTIGFDHRRVVIQADIPWGKGTRYERVGIFRWAAVEVENPQMDFWLEQLRQRWPDDVPPLDPMMLARVGIVPDA